MFFVSTPSLIISAVLAVFYLANIAIFAVNRQQKTTCAEIVSVRPQADNISRDLFFIKVEDDAPQCKSHNDIRADAFRAWFFFDRIAVDSDVFRQDIPDCDYPIIDSGIYLKLFFRPPPIV